MSFVAVFLIMTMEGWTEVMYKVGLGLGLGWTEVMYKVGLGLGLGLGWTEVMYKVQGLDNPNPKP